MSNVCSFPDQHLGCDSEILWLLTYELPMCKMYLTFFLMLALLRKTSFWPPSISVINTHITDYSSCFGLCIQLFRCCFKNVLTVAVTFVLCSKSWVQCTSIINCWKNNRKRPPGAKTFKNLVCKFFLRCKFFWSIGPRTE